MKTQINTMRKAMIGLFALLAAAMVLSIGAAPVLAETPHLSDAIRGDISPAGRNTLREVRDSLIPSGVISDLADSVLSDGGLIPDGGDRERAFPEGLLDDVIHDAIDDDTADESDDTVIEEEAAEDTVAEEPSDETVTDDAEESTPDMTEDTVVEEPGDEIVTDEAGDEPGDELIAEGAPGDEALEDSSLPYTGGNSTPWLIAGAAVVLAGIAIIVFCRRSRSEER